MNRIPNKVSRKFMHDTFKFPQYALEVHKLLSLKYNETYFVGGAIRNLLLKKKIVDIDIATSATPKQVIRILENAKISYDKTNEKFGVIVATVSNHKFEIATFRTEQYEAGRFPKIKLIKSAREDSKRRDFTINSFYYSPITKRVLDYNKGAEDIKNKLLRFVGNPQKRVEDDPLRIARAYRFALEYNLKFESRTLLALQKNLHLLKKVSTTRLQREINQISFAKQKKLKNILQKVIHSNT